MTVPVSQTATYPQASICGGFESKYTYIDPGLFNSANVTGLTPATKYFYRVGAIVSSCLSLHRGASAMKQLGMRGCILSGSKPLTLRTKVSVINPRLNWDSGLHCRCDLWSKQLCHVQRLDIGLG